MLQSFNQAFEQAIISTYKFNDEIIDSFRNETETIDPNIEANLKPNGPTLCLYWGPDCLCFEGTQDSISKGYYEQCFKDPDLKFTHNGQTILVTIDD